MSNFVFFKMKILGFKVRMLSIDRLKKVIVLLITLSQWESVSAIRAIRSPTADRVA